MLYEIGKSCDISEMLMRVRAGTNRLMMTGEIVGEPHRSIVVKNLYELTIRLIDGKLVDVYLSEEDIPHSNAVLIDGEMWNSKKGYMSYRSNVDVYAQNVVELMSISDVEKDCYNSVSISGMVCINPVYFPSQGKYEIVLLARTGLGEVVRILCVVSEADGGKSLQDFEKGSRYCVKGEIMQRPRNKRRGRSFLPDGVFNYINGEAIFEQAALI